MKQLTIKITENSHQYAELIAAKAADMDLVLLFKGSREWDKCDVDNFEDIYWNRNFEYFLCIPKHKRECLHWLNGGEIQIKINHCDWVNVDNDNRHWSSEGGFMQEDCEFRIKPKKEKRWIGVSESRATEVHVTNIHFATKEECVSYVNDTYLPFFIRNCQYVEIEIEV